MKSNKLLIIILAFLLCVSFASAGDPFRVVNNMQLHLNDIYNATNVNATYFWQNDLAVLDTNSSINATDSWFTNLFTDILSSLSSMIQVNKPLNFSTGKNLTYLEGINPEGTNVIFGGNITTPWVIGIANRSDYWDNYNTPYELNNTHYHSAENITAGTFGVGDYTFLRNTNTTGNVSIGSGDKVVRFKGNGTHLIVNSTNNVVFTKNITFSGGGKVGNYNSTCLGLWSPDGTTVTTICN